MESGSSRDRWNVSPVRPNGNLERLGLQINPNSKEVLAKYNWLRVFRHFASVTLVLVEKVENFHFGRCHV